MANQETQSIIFTCYNCNKESSYPNEMAEGETNTGAKTLIKRCTTCSAENKIEVPDGWIAKRTDAVLRGYKT